MLPVVNCLGSVDMIPELVGLVRKNAAITGRSLFIFSKIYFVYQKNNGNNGNN